MDPSGASTWGGGGGAPGGPPPPPPPGGWGGGGGGFLLSKTQGTLRGKPCGCSGSAESASGTLNVYTLTYYIWSLPAGLSLVLMALWVKDPTKDFR